MAQTRATTIAQGFSQKLLLEMYDRSLLDTIVNRDYQGEINGVGSKLNILNFSRISEKTYTGANLSADSLTENNATLTIDQYKSFYWKEMTLDNWLSYIKSPHSTVVSQKADERNRNMEIFALGLWEDAGAGNWVGENYTTGTVTVDAVTGAVTGAGGATFDATMVGKPFKAEGHNTWYRIKTFSGAQAIIIEDDNDDVASAYTGGAIVAGASFIIQAHTVTTITTTNLLEYVTKCKLALDKAEANGESTVPDSDRFLIVPPEFESVLVRASGVALHVPEVYQELVKKGFVTELQGFKVFRSNRLDGDNTDGYHIVFGHPNWMTFAEKLLQADMEEDIVGNFGTAYKDLFVYGAKVTDSRRNFGGQLFAKFA
jgi:hypothetical protein